MDEQTLVEQMQTEGAVAPPARPLPKKEVPASETERVLRGGGEAPLEIHEEELRRKVELLREVREVRGQILLNPAGELRNTDPSRVYVWVNASPQRQVIFKSLRYRPTVTTVVKKVAKDKDGNATRRWDEKVGVDSDWLCEDGFHRRGDLILYDVDKDWHDAIKKDDQIRALELTEGAEKEFEAFAERLGVPVYKPPIKT
jgi:hypothetical protein